MKLPRRLVTLLSACLIAGAHAEEKTSPAIKAEINALVKEDAKKPAAKPDPANPPKLAKTPEETAAATPESTPPAKKPETVTAAPEKTPEPPTTMPTVEVNKSKITVLDHELHEQDKEIAREAKNTKSTEVDKALNAPALTVPIFGGESTKVRTGLAQERVELMEMEKDLTEAIAHAKTKEEKADLKKQLEGIKTMRRTLESPR